MSHWQLVRKKKTPTKASEPAKAAASSAANSTAVTVTGSEPAVVAGMGTEQEKADIQSLGEALNKGGMSQAGSKEAEWNQRLASTKNNTDASCFSGTIGFI